MIRMAIEDANPGVFEVCPLETFRPPGAVRGDEAGLDVRVGFDVRAGLVKAYDHEVGGEGVGFGGCRATTVALRRLCSTGRPTRGSIVWEYLWPSIT